MPASEVEEKVHDYHLAGTRLIWVIDPVRRVVSIRPSNGAERLLGESDVLSGDEVLSGFSGPVADLFDGLAPPSP